MRERNWSFSRTDPQFVLIVRQTTRTRQLEVGVQQHEVSKKRKHVEKTDHKLEEEGKNNSDKKHKEHKGKTFKVAKDMTEEE